MTEPTPPEQNPAGFPDEAFPCPYCGQMLAPSCRVCVACKRPIDPAHIVPLAPPEPIPHPEPPLQPAVQQPSAPRARFSWSIFIWVLLAWFGVTVIFVRLLARPVSKAQKSGENSSLSSQYDEALKEYGPAQFAMDGLLLLSSVWVYFDARKKGFRRPMRWAAACAVGSAFLPIFWVFIFSWYLARRRVPEATCPFVEGDASPLTRILIFAIILVFVLGLLMTLVKRSSFH